MKDQTSSSNPESPYSCCVTTNASGEVINCTGGYYVVGLCEETNEHWIKNIDCSQLGNCP